MGQGGAGEAREGDAGMAIETDDLRLLAKSYTRDMAFMEKSLKDAQAMAFMEKSLKDAQEDVWREAWARHNASQDARDAALWRAHLAEKKL